MKSFILSSCFALLSLTAFATDYKQLWKAVSDAVEHDHPQKAVASLNSICHAAEKERIYGELLAAQLMRTKLLTEISPDSLMPHITALELQAEQAASKDKVLHAVYCAALGKVLHNEKEVTTRHGSTEYFDMALSNPDALAAAKASDYPRLIAESGDGAIWNGDLLSVIGNEAERYDMLYDYYLSHGNRRAACVELYHKVVNGNYSDDDSSLTHRRQLLRQGMNDFGDIAEGALLAQAYYNLMDNDSDISPATRYVFLKDALRQWASSSYSNALHNSLAALTQSQFTVTVDGKLLISNIRNINSLAVEFLPLKANGCDKLDVFSSKERQKVLSLVSGKSVVNINRQYEKSDWQLHNDTIDMPVLPAGVYLVKAESGSIVNYAVYYNTGIAMLTIPLNSKRTRLVAVSPQTGKPIGGVTVELSQVEYNGKVKNTTTAHCNSKGEAEFDCSFEANRIYAYTATDKAFQQRTFGNSFSVISNTVKQDIATIYTDRAIYQPGQTIKGTVMVYNAHNDDSLHVVSGKVMEIRVQDADYKEVLRDSITTDDFGHANFECVLPKGGRNGNFSITCSAANTMRGHASVRVEEYRRPTFEIITPDSLSRNTYHNGDSIRAVFRAVSMTQQPVSDAIVTYSINRRNIWWRHIWHDDATSRTIVSNAQTVTDSEGYVCIPLGISLPEEGAGEFVYDISVKVTTGNGETHDSSLRLTARKGEKTFHDEVKEQEEFVCSADAFPSDGKEVTITIRPKHATSATPAYVFYTINSGEKLLESGVLTLTKQDYTRRLTYKKEYGNSITVTCAWIYGNNAYTYHALIARPRKSLALKAHWNTFRDYTQPGAKETWTLATDGATVLTATVYDRSLDLISRLSWMMPRYQNFYLTNTLCNTYLQIPANLSAYGNIRYLNTHDISLPSFKADVLPTMRYNRFGFGQRRPLLMKTMSTNIKGVQYESAMAVEEAKAITADVMAKAENIAANEMPAAEDLSALLRTDISESACFIPSLVSNNDGTVTMQVQMPQTMTSWRVMALVHDKQMRHCLIDTVCVAKKDIIVQPNAPRFLRDGDKALLATTVQNTTALPLTATITMQMINPSTEKVIWQHAESVGIPANSNRTVNSMFRASLKTLTADSTLIFRCAAVADGRSDGEQHYVPLLPKQEPLLQRYSYPGDHTLRGAIPHAVNPELDDAVSQASAVYVAASFRDIEGNDSCLAVSTKKLADLQLTDGSWPWWKGMHSSMYITTTVTKLLARLTYRHQSTASTDSMLHKALPAMKKYLQDEAAELRKQQKKYPKQLFTPSTTSTDIMYVLALLQRHGECGKDFSYMTDLMTKAPADWTISAKAESAVIMALTSHKKKAKDIMQSIKEYSVYSKDAGRYYDSPHASYSWRNYRIPTQVAAMEALQIVSPEDSTTMREMQQWLLYEKRTQQWTSSVAIADALYAYLLGGNSLDDSDCSVAGNEDSSTSKNNGFKLKSACKLPDGITTTSEQVQIGSTIVKTITIHADRDYDFVEVCDNRSASQEPVHQLSGYRMAESAGTAYGSYTGYYEDIHNSYTCYYFEHMAKGDHRITTTYNITREGTYAEGTKTIICAYAPEFHGIQ